MATTTHTTGDIHMSWAETQVNPVNWSGVMGADLALQFKNLFPENFLAYCERCLMNGLQPGKVLVHELGPCPRPRYILNVATTRHRCDPCCLVDIDFDLNIIADEIIHRGIDSVAVPAIGCGHGGLDWKEVRPNVEKALGDLPGLEARVREPGATEQATTAGEGSHG